MRPGPMALEGLGPGVGQRGEGYGPYCWVEVQGPSGPRAPYAVQNFFEWLPISPKTRNCLTCIDETKVCYTFIKGIQAKD